MSIEQNFEKIKRDCEYTELVILVWGAGREGGEHFAKRMKIKNDIEGLFQRADVRFSEDIDLNLTFPGASELPYRSQELFHLRACDVCVVVDTSQGSHEEISHFVETKEAYKLLILTNEKFKDSTSFPADLRRFQNQVFYTDEEYKKCSMVERVLTHIKYVALFKNTTLFN